MEYLDHDAADSFYLLTVRSYDLHLIGLSELELRLACLSGMLKPDDQLFRPLRNHVPPSLAHETELIDDDRSKVEITREEYSEREIQQAASRLSFPPPPVMQLVVRGVGGMKKWVFHEYDEDPHPSIPHGHEHGKDHPKCDPYTGKVYDAHRREISEERLGRKTRIALWSDHKFREFALKAIIWCEDHHPYYSFRVAHPRRLPKFR
ncbi:hypothetical protein [Azorhizobium doebereinerae]|uniref:hypothetical protein n=1 Tax=Azorhizobium doebereinerae TaxID=281091 RepID=UPI000490A8CE|nr:hypothetical protein [Azorhizobium doebereinerae]